MTSITQLEWPILSANPKSHRTLLQLNSTHSTTNQYNQLYHCDDDHDHLYQYHDHRDLLHHHHPEPVAVHALGHIATPEHTKGARRRERNERGKGDFEEFKIVQ